MAAPIAGTARPAAAISMAAPRQSGRRSDGCVASFPSGWPHYRLKPADGFFPPEHQKRDEWSIGR